MFSGVWAVVAGVALIIMAASGGLLLVERLESSNDFCNSCHLPTGRPLHEAKMSLAVSSFPTDLTGLHFQRSRAGFLCADCHRGSGLAGRAMVLMASFRNALAYLGGGFSEPEALLHPISNATCRGCHQVDTQAPDPGRFHRIQAHLRLDVVLCTECHAAHAPDKGAGSAQAVQAGARAACERCHLGRPLPEAMQALLRGYSAWWQNVLADRAR
ncbi:MAG: hypothetical protein OEZ59_08360 [Deltaproteobacteria bacterium]|nr:hypothetical protein [Deltaproteobacteria bacterium]